MNITTHGDKPKINFLDKEKKLLRKAHELVRAISYQPGFPDFSGPAVEALPYLENLVKRVEAAE